AERACRKLRHQDAAWFRIDLSRFSNHEGSQSITMAAMKTLIPLLFAFAAAAANAGDKPMQIEGTFDVKLTPQAPADGQTWGRQTIAKTFHGALDGTSRGEMLAAGTAVKGSAGYVALEQVSATLEGRHGTFFLQHFGLMDKGAPTLTVSVIP